MTKSLKNIVNDALKLVDEKNVFKRDILFLIEDTFQVDEMDIFLHGDKEYNDSCFCEKLNRLVKGEPVEYIIGKAPFYGRDFKVTKDTLIPRNCTEELVQEVISYAKKLNLVNPSIIDIGSGSGCIAITLNKEIENASVDSCDISLMALKVAKENNIRNKANVNFFYSDCLDEAIKQNKKYDIIVSNPPYIDEDTYVQQSVIDYEPHLALFANNHGMAIYEKIFSQIDKVRKEKCLVAFEISPDLVARLEALKNKYFPQASMEFKKDMNDFVRFMLLVI